MYGLHSSVRTSLVISPAMDMPNPQNEYARIMVTHDVSCNPHTYTRTPSWRHSLEALTYSGYALCFCTRQNARDDCVANDFRGPRCLVIIQIESQLSNSQKSACVRCMMAPLRTASSERLVLIPATLKNSTTGYKNVNFDRRNMKFQVHVRDGGKRVHLGYFDTAEEAAIAYARSECGRADAAKLLQPRPAPTPAGAEAIRQAAREGLTLITSGNNNTGYKGVTFCPEQQGRKVYQLRVTAGGKMVSLGYFATAEQAALFYARREAGRDTSDLTAPPPPPPPPAPSSAAGAEAVRQAGREGLTLVTSSSSNSGYRGVSRLLQPEGARKQEVPGTS